MSQISVGLTPFSLIPQQESQKPESRQHDGPADVLSLYSLDDPEPKEPVTLWIRTIAIISSVTLVTASNTFINALVIMLLKELAIDLRIPLGMKLWPASMQALACGSTLLFAGTLADAVGPRVVFLFGLILQAACAFACATAPNMPTFLLYRTIGGFATALLLPSATGIISRSFVRRRRNFAFAAIGFGQWIGVACGFPIGGAMINESGLLPGLWRYGFRCAMIIDVVACVLAAIAIPTTTDTPPERGDAHDFTWEERWYRFKHNIDWVGALLQGLLVGLFCLALAFLSVSPTYIRSPAAVIPLALTTLLVPCFVL